MAPIESLPANAILLHLSREYGINAQRLVPTPAGLDNSVYFVYLHHTDACYLLPMHNRANETIANT